MLNAGLHQFTAVIEETCVSAQKEAALVKVMDKMEADWASMVFGTKQWRTGRILAVNPPIFLSLKSLLIWKARY